MNRVGSKGQINTYVSNHSQSDLILPPAKQLKRDSKSKRYRVPKNKNGSEKSIINQRFPIGDYLPANTPASVLTPA